MRMEIDKFNTIIHETVLIKMVQTTRNSVLFTKDKSVEMYEEIENNLLDAEECLNVL